MAAAATVGALMMAVAPSGVPAQAPARGAGPVAAEAAGLRTWTAEVTREQITALARSGVDVGELAGRVPPGRRGRVQLVLTREQAATLAARHGITLTERPAPRARPGGQRGDGVFRRYGGSGGLKEDVLATAAAHPGLAKSEVIGHTVQGQEIVALRVSSPAPATGAQPAHAPESTQGTPATPPATPGTPPATPDAPGAPTTPAAPGRAAPPKAAAEPKPAVLYLGGQHAREWITPETVRRLMHYFVDGYGTDPVATRTVDATDLWFVVCANPDGYDYTFTPGHRLWRKNIRGVDLNRNFAYKWGYDNEGSSADPSAETYRGPSPMSEPETRALDDLERRVGFRYAVNYHSAAGLLLYGIGWQVATPSPDDALMGALAGTPERPAVPGYRPQLASALYTTNGDSDGHAANVRGTLMFTPEMSPCEAVLESAPEAGWGPADCTSEFAFPDNQVLVQKEFQKNLPFALAVADSAAHPGLHPAVPDFIPSAFSRSYDTGSGQQVSVVARNSVPGKRLHWRVDGGPEQTAALQPWHGGTYYGGTDNRYFDEYRGTVPGARPGATVTVWFTGDNKAASVPFAYTVAPRPASDTLVLDDSGRAPHPLGELSHFRQVVCPSSLRGLDRPVLIALRDYLNEGGRLSLTASTVTHSEEVLSGRDGVAELNSLIERAG